MLSAWLRWSLSRDVPHIIMAFNWRRKHLFLSYCGSQLFIADVITCLLDSFHRSLFSFAMVGALPYLCLKSQVSSSSWLMAFNWSTHLQMSLLVYIASSCCWSLFSCAVVEASSSLFERIFELKQLHCDVWCSVSDWKL